jgi:hypothetical protein
VHLYVSCCSSNNICVIVLNVTDILSLFLIGLRIETCSDRQVPPPIRSGVMLLSTAVHVWQIALYNLFGRFP